MKISQLAKSTKVAIATTAASAALTAEAVALVVQTPNSRTIPLATMGLYLTINLFSDVVRNIKQDARNERCNKPI